MAVSQAAYEEQILTLLPRGRVWEGPLFRKLIQGLAGVMYRVSTAGEQMLLESDPATTDQLLPEFEKMVGLPYPGFALSGTDDERRIDVVAKLIAQGGQSKSYFLSIVVAAGHPGSTIEDGIRPLCAGDPVGTPLYGVPWVFVWTVTIAGTPNPDSKLEYLLTRYKPAHTIVRFVYV
jgi:uncharacterized protein YmfQ (DUF2313 family)